MDQECDYQASGQVRAENGAEIVILANNHFSSSLLPRAPEPHKNVGDDCDYEKDPGAVHRQRVLRPVAIVEKRAVDFGYLIVADLVDSGGRPPRRTEEPVCGPSGYLSVRIATWDHRML